MPPDRRHWLDLGPQRLGDRLHLARFERGINRIRRVHKLPVPRLPNAEEWTWIAAPLHCSTLVQTLFDRLAHQVLLETLAACIFQDACEPQQLLAGQAG